MKNSSNNGTTKTKAAKWDAVCEMSQLELCGEMSHLARELAHLGMESDAFGDLAARLGNICSELTRRHKMYAEI